MWQPARFMMLLFRKTEMFKTRNILFLGLMLALCINLFACGTENKASAGENETAPKVFDFYRLDDSEKTLWLELPVKSSGYTWKYVISDTDVLSEQSSSVMEDKTGSLAGETRGVWVASFANATNNYGDIKMELYYTGPGEKIEEMKPVYTMYLNVAADRAVTVKSITE